MVKEERKKKKIIGLRTFADDVKRARGESVETDSKESSQEKTTLASEVAQELGEVAPTVKTPATPVPPPPPTPPVLRTPAPIKQKAKEVAVTSASEAEAEPTSVPMDVPPFHHLRASSPDNTTFTSARDVHQSTKQKQGRPKQKKIQPDSIGIDTSGIEKLHDSVLKPTRDAIFDTEEAEANVGEGTIVTDRKREKFKLVPAVGEAVTDWIEEKVDGAEATHRPKHKIEKSSRRKKIIEAAAEDAKLAPGDDHSVVAARLREIERITEAEEMQVKAAAEVPEPTWTHTNGEGAETETVQEQTAQQEEEDTVQAADPKSTSGAVTHTGAITVSQSKNPEVPITPNPEARTEVHEVAATVSESESLPVTQEGTPIAASETPAAVSTPGFTASETVAVDTQAVPAAAPAATLPPNQIPQDTTDIPRFSRTPVPAYRLNRAGEPIPPTTSGTPYLTFAAVTIVAIILGIATTLWMFTDSSTTQTVAIDTTPALFTSQQVGAIPLSTDRTEFYNTLFSGASELSAEVIELEPKVGTTNATLEQIFATLRWSAPGNFIRNVSQISFGFSRDRSPFIVLRTNSFDVAFAGILAWEPYMSSDFAPLFGGAASTNSYDTKIANHDIRILTSDGRNDRIVYGFIDKHTILITTTRDVFAEIAPLITQ